MLLNIYSYHRYGLGSMAFLLIFLIPGKFFISAS